MTEPAEVETSGLLADPAQTTELEELRERAETLQQMNSSSQSCARSARAERDAASLLLRGMARKLVATRGQARLQAELSLEINQGWVAYRERTKVRRRKFLDDIATLTGERDTLEKILSKERRRVDAALALIDAGTSTGPYFLSPDETRAVRAALVGDQPGELPSELSSDLERAPDAPTELGALSGEALRDVEEADDASEESQ